MDETTHEPYFFLELGVGGVVRVGVVARVGICGSVCVCVCVNVKGKMEHGPARSGAPDRWSVGLRLQGSIGQGS